MVRAAWQDGTMWNADLPELTGRVVEAGTNEPLRDVAISISGTSHGATTDSAGFFRIAPMLPGRYTMSVADTLILSGTRGRVVQLDVSPTLAAESPVSVELPPRAGSFARACPSAVGSSSVFLLGRVSGPLVVAESLTMEATWNVSERLTATDATILRGGASASISSTGRFMLCGVPRTRVNLAVRGDRGVIADSVIVIRSAGEIVNLDWQLRSISRATTGGAIVGRVVDGGTGNPVRGAEVWVPSASSTVLTDSSGVFSVGHPTGTALLSIRRIGFEVRRDTVSVREGASEAREFRLARQAQTLDTVRVSSSHVKYASPGLQGFENRRARSEGRFISESQLRKDENRNLASLLVSHLSGLTIVAGNNGSVFIHSTRKACGGTAFSGCIQKACYATIYLDGAMIYSATNAGASPPNILQFSPSTLAGIEYYPSGGVGPAEFNRTDSGCGLLLLWTREK